MVGGGGMKICRPTLSLRNLNNTPTLHSGTTMNFQEYEAKIIELQDKVFLPEAGLGVLHAKLVSAEYINPDFMLNALEPYRGCTKLIRWTDIDAGSH